MKKTIKRCMLTVSFVIVSAVMVADIARADMGRPDEGSLVAGGLNNYGQYDAPAGNDFAQATLDTFSVNFYAYGRSGSDYWGQDEWRKTVTLEPEQAAGLGDWNTTGWQNIYVPWSFSPVGPMTITSNQGATATFTLKNARNGHPRYGDRKRTLLLGDGNGDMMDGHANCTEDDVVGIPSLPERIFDMTVSDIPFTGDYYVIINLGANEAKYAGDGTGTVVFNGGAKQGFTAKTEEFDGTFTEIIDEGTAGNYLSFEGVPALPSRFRCGAMGTITSARAGFRLHPLPPNPPHSSCSAQELSPCWH